MLEAIKNIAGNMPGKGRDDDVPALVSEGEYIIPADVVSMIGDGNTEAGAKILDQFIEEVRQSKGANDGILKKLSNGKK